MAQPSTTITFGDRDSAFRWATSTALFTTSSIHRLASKEKAFITVEYTHRYDQARGDWVANEELETTPIGEATDGDSLQEQLTRAEANLVREYPNHFSPNRIKVRFEERATSTFTILPELGTQIPSSDPRPVNSLNLFIRNFIVDSPKATVILVHPLSLGLNISKIGEFIWNNGVAGRTLDSGTGFVDSRNQKEMVAYLEGKTYQLGHGYAIIEEESCLHELGIEFTIAHTSKIGIKSVWSILDKIGGRVE
ncbi:hypothetical protein K469DRAFT_745361 [Zopfia rhizophila CBS 207.26]|uniref:Uncharacterized protein n=1 Tax=Zopfia rhizophila CBS 207.26 TaxID=1314779 RepID=A0A6A6EQ51_9PEZI|nr:hypothetical protein K469DRAFT_745361 [Zopfia rhizophila CBS 207.26]